MPEIGNARLFHFASILLTGLAPSITLAESGGTISNIKGSVQLRGIAATQPARLDAGRDAHRELQRGDAMKIDAGGSVDIRIGAETIRLNGPRDWFTIQWTCRAKPGSGSSPKRAEVSNNSSIVAGRIGHMSGTVRFRVGATTQPAPADIEPRPGRFLHFGDELRIDKSGAVEIRIGTESIVLNGPLDWYPVSWIWPGWSDKSDEEEARKLLDALARRGGQPRGPDAIRMSLVKLATFDLPVCDDGLTDLATADAIRSALPTWVRRSEARGAGCLHLVTPPAEGGGKSSRVRVERDGGALVGEATEPDAAQAIADILMHEAWWRGISDLRNDDPGCPIKVRIRFQDAPEGGKPVEFHDGDAVKAVVENLGTSTAFFTLVSVTENGDVEIEPSLANQELSGGGHRPLSFKARGSQNHPREWLIVVASAKPLGADAPGPRDWNADRVSYTVK